MSSTRPAAPAAQAHSHEAEKGKSLQTELTSSLQFDGAGLVPASPTLADHSQHDHLQSDRLTFPTLESDGSLPDLREASTSTHYSASAAALSSLGADTRMVGGMKMEASTDSLLDEQYDMVDDASETTNDDRETASLASTEDAMSDDDEGEMTPEEDEDNVIKFNAGSVGDLAGTLYSGNKQQSTEEDNRIMDSYMSDDLETPRQSTIQASPASVDTAIPPATNAAMQPLDEKANPVSLRALLYCSKTLDSPLAASMIASYIASSIASVKAVPQTIVLPPTPDNTAGSIISRFGNALVTVDILDSSASELEINALVQRTHPDLVVLYLAEIVELPPSHISQICNDNERDFKTLVIPQSTEGMDRVDVQDRYDMSIDEHSFFADPAKTRTDLRRLMGARLAIEGQRARHTKKKTKKMRMYKQEVLPSWTKLDSGLMRMALGALILALIAPAFLTYNFFTSPAAVTQEHQRETLSLSLMEWINVPASPDSDLIGDLVPGNSPQATFTIFPPNHVALSVTDQSGVPGSGVLHVNVSRPDGRIIDCNLTTLADGVVGFALPVDEMHGMITINVAMKSPPCPMVLTHDFGSPLWHRSTYQKASTDLTKAINKDVAVARKAAKSLTDRVSLEVSAGVAATHNVTTQLAVRMTREISVLAIHATGVFGKVASNGIGTAKQISKEIAVVRKDLIRCVDDVKKSIATTAHSIKDLIVPSKKSFTSPLKTSRQRAVGFKEAMSGKKAKAQQGDSSPSRVVGAQRDNIFGGFGKRDGAKKDSKCGTCKSKAKCDGCS